MKNRFLIATALLLAFAAASLYSFQEVRQVVLDLMQVAGVANPLPGNARLFVNSGSQILNCLLPNGSSCMPSGASNPARIVPIEVDYYISPTGSDTAACSSAAPCATLAHVLTLLPQTLQNYYVVHIADGTYSEPINTAGFLGSGSAGLFGGTTYGAYLQLLGDVANPQNVTFNGLLNCSNSYQSTACIGGSGLVKLTGITISGSKREGLSCYGGTLELNNVRIVMTGGASQASVGMNALGCNWTLDQGSSLSISGFDTNIGPTGGLGLYNSFGTFCWINGTLNITGPGNTDLTDGMVLEHGAWIAMQTSTAALNISGVTIGLQVGDNGSFESYVGAGASITNTTAPSGSIGISVSSSGAVNFANGGTLTISNYSTCIQAAANSEMTHGGASRTLSCPTQTNALQGSQIVLF